MRATRATRDIVVNNYQSDSISNIDLQLIPEAGKKGQVRIMAW